ncbi:MAG: ABC transporter permease [Candidatus Bipolaricaulota bacterium]|nr:ABC transporter permease [Candidatus Bipolaricaulota bacterium]MDW8126656.1 ABC transporter permease [Candidatus Bipolaricaulota bacterium]
MLGLSALWAMWELELRRLRHDRLELYTRAVQPLLWIGVFGPIMGAIRAIPTGGIPYTSFITPGVLIQSTTFVSIFYGLTIVWERESGILKKLLVTPASRASLVVGRAMAAGVRAVVQALVIVPIALLVGVRFYPHPLYFLGALGVIFLSSGGFAALSMLVASFLKTRERFMGIGQALTFPLFFASNALYPVAMMPKALQVFAQVNPMSYVVDAVRALIITGDTSRLGTDLLAILAFDLLMFAVASASFRRIIE